MALPRVTIKDDHLTSGCARAARDVRMQLRMMQRPAGRLTTRARFAQHVSWRDLGA